MIRLIFNIALLIAVGYGALWLWDNNPMVRSFVQDKIETGKFLTLEEKYSVDQIMTTNQKTFLKDDSYSFLEPSLVFYPYLLMEVKYMSSEDKTGEGMLLWGLDNGEMVIDSSTWERSHGFEDAINAGATRNDFKILNVLASSKTGMVGRDSIANALHLDGDLLDSWLESCRKKQLIIRTGNSYRIHLDKPKLNVPPVTKINTWLVTKPYKGADRISKRYSASQVENICKAAFGESFAIRTVSEVFLPVYIVRVLNPDKSVLTTYWNALNGQRIK